MKLKLAILLCDTPADDIKKEFGDYRVLFTNLLNHPDLQIDSFDVVNGNLPPIADFDAFLLTGSKFSANDKDQWIEDLIDFLKRVKNIDHKKVVGICFGHQLIARALGGKVVKNPKGWEIGMKKVVLNPKGAEFYKRDGDLNLKIQEMHQDHVVEEPDFMEVIAGNEVSPNQIMLSDRFYSIQGHPEYSREFVDALIQMRLKSGLFSKEMVDAMPSDQQVGVEGMTIFRNSIFKFLGLS